MVKQWITHSNIIDLFLPCAYLLHTFLSIPLVLQLSLTKLNFFSANISRSSLSRKESENLAESGSSGDERSDEEDTGNTIGTEVRGNLSAKLPRTTVSLFLVASSPFFAQCCSVLFDGHQKCWEGHYNRACPVLAWHCLVSILMEHCVATHEAQEMLAEMFGSFDHPVVSYTEKLQ